jgi:hydroxymethylpyrimidine/phosphomethylpyrimidine kinase
MTFAASDPTGGAGLQADLITFASMGCYGLSVLTGMTVQDSSGVEEFEPVDAEWVENQARLVLEDMPVAAFKIGVLGSVDNVSVVAEILADYPDVPLIFDPVLASGRGDEFADDDQLAAMRELIVPQSTLITPNSLEVRRLADEGMEAEPLACVQRLLGLGAEYVLVTGTHENTPDVVNTLYGESGVVRADRWPRLPASYHGSGCTLASAIAALLANGLGLPEAVREAQEFTWQALSSGFRPGMGQYFPDRMFWAREMEANGDEGDADNAGLDGARAEDDVDDSRSHGPDA